MGIHAGFPINFAALNFIKGEFLGLEVEFCKKAKIEKKYEKLRILLDLCQRKYKIVRYE